MSGHATHLVYECRSLDTFDTYVGICLTSNVGQVFRKVDEMVERHGGRASDYAVRVLGRFAKRSDALDLKAETIKRFQADPRFKTLNVYGKHAGSPPGSKRKRPVPGTRMPTDKSQAPRHGSIGFTADGASCEVLWDEELEEGETR